MLNVVEPLASYFHEDVQEAALIALSRTYQFRAFALFVIAVLSVYPQI